MNDVQLPLKLKNPVIYSDFPDPDVICVDNTYYMISTTMYYYPGGVILRSYDLCNWEICTRVFDNLKDLPTEKLQGEQQSYGKGMWAASLRYQDGLFYVIFTAFETCSTFIFTAKNIEGPWERHVIPEICHEPSFLFTGGKKYVVYGAGDIRIRELEDSLDGFKKDGIDKIIISDTDEVFLRFEGTHAYEINGKIYIFLIHWPKGGKRSQVCFISDSVDGEYERFNVFDDDLGFYHQGVAQGGLVQSAEGDWYSFMLQDHGAIGRVPVMIPVKWNGYVPEFVNPSKLDITLKSLKPEHSYEPLWTSEFFKSADLSDRTLMAQWEWNHLPSNNLWERTNDGIGIRTGKICANITQAQNMLTQRMFGPKCSASVCVDASELQDGDFAGLSAFISCYAWIGISREIGRYFITVSQKNPRNQGKGTADYLPSREVVKLPMDGNVAEFKIAADYTNLKDTVELFYKRNGRWVKLYEQKEFFELETFVGCRFGLFVFSTKRIGGEVTFWDFQYNYLDER